MGREEEALLVHSLCRGKIEIVPKCPIRSFDDFSVLYTPYVAEPCKRIFEEPERVFEYTNRANTVAIVTDGTRVLGLGDIGPLAALPVMEGKALLFKYLGGVDAFPIAVDTKDGEELVHVVRLIAPSFGGVNLEDIESPKCFDVLEKLRQGLSIPVWHDDQQGTASVTLAGLINALKIVKKDIGNVGITLIGAGAANICVARILMKAGADPKRMIVVDSRGILNMRRGDIPVWHRQKRELCAITNGEGRDGGPDVALRGQDVLIALSKPGPDGVKGEWIEGMARDPIVFACANPVPEIWPEEARRAGARIVATGRSDFPNQINNALGFPGIFRGALDVRAKTITDEMCIAAAFELAKFAEERGIREDYIVPTFDEAEVFVREAVAVAKKAMEQNVARLRFPEKELYEMAKQTIERARAELGLLMEKGIVRA
jgi:malate dehydrogenase (oxaloacetate-decarboxylating)